MFKKLLKNYWPLIIILLVVGVLFSIHLGRDQFGDWDECVYGQQAKEMKLTGNFITNQWNQEIVFEKPPLYNWLIQIPFIFAVNETAARIPMLLVSLILIVAIYLFSEKFFSKRVAILSSLLLLTSELIVAYIWRVNTDIGFTLFVFLGVYCWFLSFKKSSFSYLAGLFLGLAILTKGLGVIPYMGGLAVGLVFNLKKEYILNYLKMSLVLFVVAAPWHIYHIIKYGDAFLQVYFFEHIIKRANNTLDFHFEGRLFYIKLFLKQLFPWIFIPVLIPLFYFKNLIQLLKPKKFFKFMRENHVIMSILILFVVVLIAITRVKTRISWYAMPLLPFVAILLASSIEAILKKFKGNILMILVTIAIIIDAGYTIIHEVRLTDFKKDIPPRNEIFMEAKQLPEKEINYLVWKPERIAEAILPANMRTSTTFVYGGNPCAVYYSEKKIHYYYSTDTFMKQLKSKEGLFVIEKGDLPLIKDLPIKVMQENDSYLLFMLKS